MNITETGAVKSWTMETGLPRMAHFQYTQSSQQLLSSPIGRLDAEDLSQGRPCYAVGVPRRDTRFNEAF